MNSLPLDIEKIIIVKKNNLENYDKFKIELKSYLEIKHKIYYLNLKYLTKCDIFILDEMINILKINIKYKNIIVKKNNLDSVFGFINDIKIYKENIIIFV